MSETHPAPEQPPRRSTLRSGLILLAVITAMVAAALGSGAAGGTPIDEAAGGWFSADATPLAPASPAFRIWSAIYLGLLLYAVTLQFPSVGSSARHRRIGPWAAASAVLNAAWIFSVQAGLITLSLVIIGVLLVVLLRMLLMLRSHQPLNWWDRLITDGTFGLYLGWVCVASAANAASWAGAAGANGFLAWEFAAIAVVVVLAGIALGLARYTGAHIAPALSISWGLLWIGLGRIDGDFASTTLVATGAVTALAVLAGTVFFRAFIPENPLYYPRRPPLSVAPETPSAATQHTDYSSTPRTGGHR